MIAPRERDRERRGREKERNQVNRYNIKSLRRYSNLAPPLVTVFPSIVCQKIGLIITYKGL